MNRLANAGASTGLTGALCQRKRSSQDSNPRVVAHSSRALAPPGALEGAQAAGKTARVLARTKRKM